MLKKLQIVMMALMLTTAFGTQVFAEDMATNGNMNNTNTTGYQGNNNNYRTTAADNDTNWEWVGWLGLLGLFGLRGRNRDSEPNRR